MEESYQYSSLIVMKEHAKEQMIYWMTKYEEIKKKLKLAYNENGDTD